MRRRQHLGKVVMVVVMVVVVVGIAVLLHTRPDLLSTMTDPEDVTPGVATSANLNGLWYGPLTITRYDTTGNGNTGNPSDHLTEGFYLKISLQADNSVMGTYTTCSLTNAGEAGDRVEYTMQQGVLNPNGKWVNLYLFAPMYGTVNGDSMTLHGERYVPHGDAVTDSYASTLHKVADGMYLSACYLAHG